MIDKEEFIKIYMESVFDSSNNTGEKLWSYFQSKQQEKIERVKKLKIFIISEGYYTMTMDGPLKTKKDITKKYIKLSDVLSILEEE